MSTRIKTEKNKYTNHDDGSDGGTGSGEPGAGAPGGPGPGPGPSPQPPVQAAHVSKVYVYSQLLGRLTAVHESGTSGPELPASGQTKATVT